MNNMRLPELIYHEPTSIYELLEIKKEFKESCSILAGGTDLIPMLKRRNLKTRHLLNLKKIPKFNEIFFDQNNWLHIGPAVTLHDIIEHPMISRSYPLLAQAAASVGFNQLRNMATLIGNICLDNKCTYFNQSALWWKSRPNCFKREGDMCYVSKQGKKCFALSVCDTASALVALEAEIVIRGTMKERRILLEEFFTGEGRKPHKLDKDEVVTAILIHPPSTDWREAYLKKSARGSVDFCIASLSVRLKMNTHAVDDIRIAVNGVSSRPIRCKTTECYLAGRKINDKILNEAARQLLMETAPISKISFPTYFRKQMIKVMFLDLVKAKIMI